LLGGAFGQSAANGLERTHCQANEQILFSCKVGQEKIVSICASKNLSSSSRYVQYRFGKSGALELQYPDNLKGSFDRFRFSSVPYSGGGEAHIRFSNKNFEYIIYDREVKSNEAVGVLVRQGKQSVSQRKCQSFDYAYISRPGYVSLPKEPFEDVLP
jgi:hypothetical protein